MGTLLFHIATVDDWSSASDKYTPSQFKTDGFIHCSTANQVKDVAGRLFAGRNDLVILGIDLEKITAPVRYENLEGGKELYPHVYGPLDVAAVISSEPIPTGDDGELEISQCLLKLKSSS